MKRSIAVVAMLVVGFAATTCAQTGREIAQKVKDRPDGDTRRYDVNQQTRSGARTQAHFLLHRCGQRKERPQEHHVLPISRRCKGDGLLDVGL